MRPKLRWTKVLGGLAGVAVTAALMGMSPTSASGGEGQIRGTLGRQETGVGEGPQTDPAFAARRLRALNADRHKSMVSDAEKLVKLARQLDAEVASNSSGALTPEELHKVAEIEKLAKSVKTKMTQTFEAGPALRQPVPLSGPGPD